MNEFLCVIKDAISRGKVDERVDRTRRASREIEIEKTKGKELDNRYDKQCKGMEREFKRDPKDYEKGNDEKRRSKCNISEKECVKRSDELRKDGTK